MGRAIAETKHSRASSFITLTYGRDDRNVSDHMRARVLTYSDVQKYLKLLRWHKYPMRYIAVGEYGSLKGRCHWHVIIFWKERVPEHPVGRRFQCPFWPHGYSEWDEAGPGAVRYVCKYIQKDYRDIHQQSSMMMSKRPLIGARYFEELAGRYVEQGLSPQDPYYDFPEVTDRQGKKIRFKMAGATLKLFLQSFLDQWRARYTRLHPWSPLLNDYEDSLLPERTVIEPRRHVGRVPKPEGNDLMAFMDPRRIFFDEKLNVFYYQFDYGQSPWYWTRNANGELEWQNDLRKTKPSTTGR